MEPYSGRLLAGRMMLGTWHDGKLIEPDAGVLIAPSGTVLVDWLKPLKVVG